MRRPGTPAIPVGEVLDLFKQGKTYSEIREILWKEGEGAIYHLSSLAALVGAHRRVDPSIPHRHRGAKIGPRKTGSAAVPIEAMAVRHRDVLQAIIDNAGLRWIEVEDVSGYAGPTCKRVIWELKQVGLVERYSGRYFATEKGSIVYAIIVGKESRARGRKQNGVTNRHDQASQKDGDR